MFKVRNESVRLIIGVIIMSIIVGSTIAFFLNSLAWVTHIRIQYPWLFYILPLAGLVLFFLYKHFGQNTIAGNNLIIDEIHQPQNGVPILMAPFILFSTLFTHLFGGSAGREGTAVQIGGSIASYIGEKFQLSKANRSLLLMTGVSAGFGAVFGTPLAGTIFAIEVLVFAHLYHRTLIYCLIAAYLGHLTCLAYGVHHTSYSIQSGLSTTNPKILPIVIIAAMSFGWVAKLFVFGMHKLKAVLAKMTSFQWMIPVIGASVLIVLSWLLNTRDYLGLGVGEASSTAISIVNSFHQNGVMPLSWFWKMLFTIITLSVGFKGGEVTPLFFIGAALGNAIAFYTGAPVDLLAALGFIAVFGAATNTPLASAVMGIEIFGSEYLGYFVLACFLAYFVSGRSRIYTVKSQDRHS